MKAKLVLSSFAALSIVSCSSIDKMSGEAQAKIDAANSKFKSFDLTCEYGEIASSGVIDDSKSQSSSCAKAKEYYAILLKSFDVDRDGKLSDSEIELARLEYEKEKLLSLDKDCDGKITETEKAEWRGKELAERDQKLEDELRNSPQTVVDDKGVKAAGDVKQEDRREDRREDRDLEVELGDDKGKKA